MAAGNLSVSNLARWHGLLLGIDFSWKARLITIVEVIRRVKQRPVSVPSGREGGQSILASPRL